MIGIHPQALSENLDSHLSISDKFIILGDFNVELGIHKLSPFVISIV